MTSISLCMIVRDEEASLDACLSSVKDIADEIIIVDTGSIDKTKEIASKYTDKIYDFEWIDDFSAARNFSFSKATKEYIMWLDADDIISDENRKRILALKNKALYADMYVFTYNYATDPNGAVTVKQYVERLLKRASSPKWIGEVHEYIPQGDKSIEMRLDIEIDHRHIKTTSNTRNIRIFEKMMHEGKTLTAREKYLYASSLLSVSRLEEASPIFSEYARNKNALTGMRLQAISSAAVCEIRLENYETAEKLITDFIKDIEPDADLLYILAMSIMSQRRFEEAISAYHKAISAQPKQYPERMTHPEYRELYPYIRIAECYIQLRNKSMAETFNEKAAAIAPDNEDVITNRFRINLML